MSIVTRLDELLTDLRTHRFETVDYEHDQAVIRQTPEDVTFVLTHSDEWVQAAQTLLDAPAFAKRRLAICELAMRIHGRFLGVRFGFDEDEALVVQYDIYPDMSAEHVAFALGQLAYVATTTLPLFEECVNSEHAITDDRVDFAFGLTADEEEP